MTSQIPSDIYEEILSYLQQDDLFSCALASSHMSAIAQRYLYAEVILDKGWDQISKFASALRVNSSLSPLVRSIQFQADDLWYHPNYSTASDHQNWVFICSILSPSLKAFYFGIPQIPGSGVRYIYPRSLPSIASAIFGMSKSAPQLDFVTFEGIWIGHPENITNLFGLRKLRLWEIAGLSEEFDDYSDYEIALDSPLTSLQELALSGCDNMFTVFFSLFCNPTFQKFNNLEKLELGGICFDERTPAALESLTRLKSLSLTEIEWPNCCDTSVYIGLSRLTWIDDIYIHLVMDPVPPYEDISDVITQLMFVGPNDYSGGGPPTSLQTVRLKIEMIIFGYGMSHLKIKDPKPGVGLGRMLGSTLDDVFTNTLFHHLRSIDLQFGWREDDRISDLEMAQMVRTIYDTAPMLVEERKLHVTQ